MRRRAGTIVLGAFATIALFLVIWIAPQHREFGTRVYLIVVAALAIRALALEVLGSNPLGPVGRRVAGRRPESPEALVRIERALALAPSSARETHHRVRPMLREIAADRLEVHRRIDLDAEPERARAVLGDEAWALLRGDRPRPSDPQLPGIDLTGVAAIVDRLEAI
jgi:hypothetical protein